MLDMQHEIWLREPYPLEGNIGTVFSATTINDEEPQQIQKMFEFLGNKSFMKQYALGYEQYTLWKA